MAKLATRLERLEKRLGATDEMRYQAACHQHSLLWIPHFSAALEKRMTWEELEAWEAANPGPQRQRPPTPQERVEAARLKQEILAKLEETRRRLKMWAPERFAGEC
jgi:hypothetical protein